MVDPLLQALLNDVSSYIKNPTSIDKIKEAYNYAKLMHTGQMRRTGEPYITHPVAVARIIASLTAGPDTIIAALLHDIVEDTDATSDDLLKQFGQDVAEIVEGVTKLRKLQFQTNSLKSENHQKMIIAMAKDIRVILIKIADRLHNMRTLDFMPDDRQKDISNETLEIYAPIAHRLGLFRIKAELEDRSLRYTDPNMYYQISQLIQQKKSEREESINSVIKQIKELLIAIDLKDVELKGRIKNIYSIYKKMVFNNRSFEDIYDLLAVRIIVDKIETCYQALGIIHANFTPIPRRFKDYIAVPKPNLYQSLHTTVLNSDGTLFEVQIRTHEMDEIAEYGIAAHWAYKENKVYSKEKEQFEIAQKLKWYGELLKISEDEDEMNEGAEMFVETIKQDILSANVYVFTPKGEVIELPKGATPIDFAYRIHTEVGHHTIGAIVNNRIVPLDHELVTGSVISIKTNKNSTGPSEDWLKIARSSHARNKIKTFINKRNKDKLLEQGKSSLLDELSEAKSSSELTDDFVKENFTKYNITTVLELYLEVGKGVISPKTVSHKLNNPNIDKGVFLERQMEKANRQLIATSDTGVVIEGLTNPQIKLANCCFPVLGDQIVGYVTKGQGIVIHTNQCPNVETYNKDRLIAALWGSNVTRKFPAWLKIVGSQRQSLISDIIQTSNANGNSILEVNIVNSPKLETVVKLKVSVKNLDDLTVLVSKLHQIGQIYEIERDLR